MPKNIPAMDTAFAETFPATSFSESAIQVRLSRDAIGRRSVESYILPKVLPDERGLKFTAMTFQALSEIVCFWFSPRQIDGPLL